MNEDQEHDGKEGGGVSPAPAGEQAGTLSVCEPILGSDPSRSEGSPPQALRKVDPEELPDRTGQRWDARKRQWVADREPPAPFRTRTGVRRPLLVVNPQTERVREHKVMRDPLTGRILPGSSGNPAGVSKDGKRHGGRPKLAYREALGVLEPLALATLRKALRSKHATVAATAAQDILDRLHGKPTQPIKDVTPVRLIIHRDY